MKVTEDQPLSIDRLPTLTEVLELGRAPAQALPEAAADLPLASPSFVLSFPDPPSAEPPVLQAEAPNGGAPAAPLAPLDAETSTTRGLAVDAVDAEALVALVLARLEPRLGE